MPRKPRKTLRIKRQLNAVEIAYLSDEYTDLDGNFSLWCFRHCLPGWDDDPHPRDLWETHKEDFLPAYIEKNPGKRPLPWWQWSAPRCNDPFVGWYFHGTLPEPRQRIGGTGTPDFEAKNYVPHFHKGIPSGWIPESIDPNDPPIFESQAAYLQRHGFLTAQEQRYLQRHPEELQPEVFNAT